MMGRPPDIFGTIIDVVVEADGHAATPSVMDGPMWEAQADFSFCFLEYPWAPPHPRGSRCSISRLMYHLRPPPGI